MAYFLGHGQPKLSANLSLWGKITPPAKNSHHWPSPSSEVPCVATNSGHFLSSVISMIELLSKCSAIGNDWQKNYVHIFLSRLLAYNCGTCCRIGELSIWSRHGCLPTLNRKAIKVEILPYFHWYVTKWLFWIIMYSLNSCWCSKKGYSMKMVLLAVLTTLEATSKQVQECSVLALHGMFQQILSIIFSWERQV